MTSQPPLPHLRTPVPRHWLLVLCLIGVDYFSTLAYLPSITFEVAGVRGLPATAVVVLVTFLAALPVYWRLAARSPGGLGSIALVERLVHGWLGKTLILVLLGFAATDFLMTRTLSVADAAEHLIHNDFPAWRYALQTVTQYTRDALGSLDIQAVLANLDPLAVVGVLLAGLLALTGSVAVGRWRKVLLPVAAVLLGGLALVACGEWLVRATVERLSEQVVITLLLSVLAFVLWAVLLRRGFTAATAHAAVGLVAAYLSLNAVVLGAGLLELCRNPDLLRAWWDRAAGAGTAVHPGSLLALLVLSLPYFPQLALGLSGFEFSLLVMPQVRADGGDDEQRRRARVRSTRKALLLAAAVMAVYLTAAVAVTNLLLPPDALTTDGAAKFRALAYLAHGGTLTDGRSAAELCPLFGPAFGVVFDAATILILSLAGISVVAVLETLLPRFLHRFGMDLEWVDRWKLLFRAFLIINLVTTVVFKANVNDQRGAYATGVLALFTNAAVLTFLDRWQQARDNHAGSFLLRVRAWLAVVYFGLVAVGFLAATLYVIVTSPSGLVIAVLFTLAILMLAIFSRAVRSGELRTEGFDFADDESRFLWESMKGLEFPVLVPHRPGRHARDLKERTIRSDHNLAADLDLLFLEIHLSDPSDFSQRPVVRVFQEDRRFVVQISRCVAIPHAVAAVALEFSKAGSKPPNIHFGWSEHGLLAAAWSFLVFGEGNVPGVVRELLERAEPNEARRPRVVVG